MQSWTAYDGVNPTPTSTPPVALKTRYLHGCVGRPAAARTDPAAGTSAWYLTDRLVRSATWPTRRAP